MTRPIRTISLSDPTPERRAKAVDIGHQRVGRREVRKLMTTLDWLEYHHHLDNHPHCRRSFKLYCEKRLEADGVNATDEHGGSTSRLISGYGDETFVAYGPRDGISDRQFEARTFVRCIEAELPHERECIELLDQLVGEETGALTERPKSRARYGRAFNWQQDKQAGAAGAMLAISICFAVHHAVKRFQMRQRKHSRV